MPVTLTGAHLEAPIVVSASLYSDNTPMVKVDDWAEAIKADTMTIQSGSLMDFMTGMFLADAIAHAGGWVETLVLPYLPGARQDRTNPTGDVLFTARSMAGEINRRQFVNVITVDPHSPVMPNMIRGIKLYPLNRIANAIIKRYDGIIAPDSGAEARASAFARTKGLSIYFGSKQRDPATGKLSGFSIDVPKGHYLVVDDICDGGGTFMGLAEEIKRCGATADLYVTHGIFAKRAEPRLLKHYQDIFTTDSLPRYEDTKHVHVINILDEMRTTK